MGLRLPSQAYIPEWARRPLDLARGLQKEHLGHIQNRRGIASLKTTVYRRRAHLSPPLSSTPQKLSCRLHHLSHPLFLPLLPPQPPPHSLPPWSLLLPLSNLRLPVSFLQNQLFNLQTHLSFLLPPLSHLQHPLSTLLPPLSLHHHHHRHDHHHRYQQ